MTAITEDYISFKTAKLLKEKGFDNISSIMYKENGEMCINPKSVVSWRLKYWYPCLTLQMAMKWLRDIHGLHVYPDYVDFLRRDKVEVWVVKIVDMKTFKDYSLEYTYSSYEQACEAAIKYCLENLI